MASGSPPPGWGLGTPSMCPCLLCGVFGPGARAPESLWRWPGFGSLSEELLPPAETGALSLRASTSCLCLMLLQLLLALLGILPGQVICPDWEGLRFLGLLGSVLCLGGWDGGG